jgi:hypothetical protein
MNDPRRYRELFVATGFAVVTGAAHLVWSPMVEYWQFLATTGVFVAGLAFWLVREWRGLGQFTTKFYCGAVILDLFAEGVLQPFHHCTRDNLLCTGRLFLVFFAGWLIARPVERWLLARRGLI